MIIQILLAAIVIFAAISFNCTGQGKTEFSWSNLPKILEPVYKKDMTKLITPKMLISTGWA